VFARRKRYRSADLALLVNPREKAADTSNHNTVYSNEVLKRRRPVTEYYKAEDLDKFGDVGKHNPALFKKFIDWYTSALEPGKLTKREKVLIGVGVAHVIQCPYCIDAYTKSCLEEGMSLEHITEAVHVASAIRGGASLIHTLQAHNTVDRNSL
jgi:alkylhydroperoxidase/carboxymuconolactone decarboxylase family protein